MEIPRGNNPLVDIELWCKLLRIYNLIREFICRYLSISRLVCEPTQQVEFLVTQSETNQFKNLLQVIVRYEAMLLSEDLEYSHQVKPLLLHMHRYLA